MIAQRGRLEISRSRLLHNVEVLRRRLGHTKLCATIKANAYGHGVEQMAELLSGAGVEWVCVYSLEEAFELARAPGFAVLVLAPLVLTENGGMAKDILLALRGQIRLTLMDVDSAVRLGDLLAGAGIEEPVNVHVQVDAGLTRSGVVPAEVGRLVEVIEKSPQLHLEGVFSHFSHGDVPGHATLEEQAGVFREVAGRIKKRHPHVMLHLQNSGGVFNVEPSGFDMARVGIALYGLQASTAHPIADLLPIARVVAPILAIHTRAENVGVGYGHTFTTKQVSRLAVVPVGYAEGYPRMLSNRCVAQVRGREVPVVGRVSMDQIIVDITDVPEAMVGGEVVVISWEAGKANSLDAMADAMGTIGYELATHLGSRLERVIVE